MSQCLKTTIFTVLCPRDLELPSNLPDLAQVATALELIEVHGFALCLLPFRKKNKFALKGQMHQQRHRIEYFDFVSSALVTRISTTCLYFLRLVLERRKQQRCAVGLLSNFLSRVHRNVSLSTICPYLSSGMYRVPPHTVRKSAPALFKRLETRCSWQSLSLLTSPLLGPWSMALQQRVTLQHAQNDHRSIGVEDHRKPSENPCNIAGEDRSIPINTDQHRSTPSSLSMLFTAEALQVCFVFNAKSAQSRNTGGATVAHGLLDGTLEARTDMKMHSATKQKIFSRALGTMRVAS